MLNVMQESPNGMAPASQAGSRGFDSRLLLQFKERRRCGLSFFFYIKIAMIDSKLHFRRTDPMNKEEFLNATREFFRSQGFQLLKKSKFYYDSEEFILKIDLQPSNYSEQFYLNYNIRIKAIHKEIKQIEDKNGWDLILGRIIAAPDRAFIVAYNSIAANEYLKQLKLKYERQIKPIIDRGVGSLLYLYRHEITYIHFRPGVLQFLEQYRS